MSGGSGSYKLTWLEELMFKTMMWCGITFFVCITIIFIMFTIKLMSIGF